MDWVTASILMFVSSVVFYLVARKAALLKMPTEIINFSSSAVAIFVYLALALNDRAGLRISGYGLFVIIVLSVIGSYLPNVASFNSIRHAPNPGFSLIISKSYVVLTAIASIYLFGSPLTMKSSLSILVIIFFSALITIGGKNRSPKTTNPIWIPLAFVAFFGWGLLSLGSKYAFTVGVSVPQRLFYLAIFITLYACIEIAKKRIKVQFDSKRLPIMFLLGIFFSLFNYFMLVAIDKAPNIGYVNAINAGSISALTVLSSLFYKDEFTIRKFIGVLGVTAGIIVLVL